MAPIILGLLSLVAITALWFSLAVHRLFSTDVTIRTLHLFPIVYAFIIGYTFSKSRFNRICKGAIITTAIVESLWVLCVGTFLFMRYSHNTMLVDSAKLLFDEIGNIIAFSITAGCCAIWFRQHQNQSSGSELDY
jgi:hypothetical protein